MSETLIAARNLYVEHDGNPVLDNVGISVAPGEIVTIVGPNGSGKTTLLRSLIGAIRPLRGEVVRRPGLRLGYVPQRLAIDPTLPMTVARFMALGAGNLAGDKAAVSAGGAIDAALGAAGVAGLTARQLTALSGGQFQRVLLARALLGDPHLLLLDEPTTGLDQAGSAAFYTQIEAVRRQSGAAVLLVSHELHVVMSASDRVVCLNGHVCCHGAPDVVASAPEYRALFGSGTKGALALYRHDHDHHHHGADAGDTHAV